MTYMMKKRKLRQIPRRLLTHRRRVKFLKTNPNKSFPQFEAIFGCTEKETGFFKTLQTDGILGLGPDSNTITKPPTMVQMMHKAKVIKSSTFSLCFGTEGGYTVYGGYNRTKHLESEKPQTIKYTKNYKIEINKILSHDHMLNKKKASSKNLLKKKIYGVLDTGSSFTYLPFDAFSGLQKQFTKFCSGHSKRCGGNPNFDQGYCTKFDRAYHKDLRFFFESFPRFIFKFGDKTYIWFPEDYLTIDMNTQAKDGSSVFYCSGVKLNTGGKKNEAKLGVNFMKHYDWYFNRNVKSLAFTRSTCDEEIYNKEPVPVLSITKMKKDVVGQFDVIGTS